MVKTAYKLLITTVLLLILSISVVIVIPLFKKVSDNLSRNIFDLNEPQCGHWAILRSCELLGVPIEMQTIKELLHPKQQGASMLELHDVLKKIGLKSTGHRETVDGLSKFSCPFIAHVGGDHFVTVSSIDDKKVIFFDGNGRARTKTLSEFDKEWSKTLLVVERIDRTVPLPSFANRKLKGSPCIEFETLVIDKGDISWNDKEIEYEFLVYNIGETPLIIKNIETDCGCLKAESPNEPILSEGMKKIKLKYNLKENQGSYKHEAIVESNDPSLPLVKLTAAGNTNTQIAITPDKVYLGGIIPRQKKTEIVNLHYTGDIPFEILDVLSENKRIRVVPFLLTPENAEKFKIGLKSNKMRPYIIPNTYILQITYEAKIEDIGKTKIDTIIVHTNIEGFENMSIPVFAQVKNPVTLYPSVILFTDVKPDEVITKAIEVVSFDDSPFQIISVKTGNTGINYLIKQSSGNLKTLEFSAKGADLLNLSESNIEIEIVTSSENPMKYIIKLPVYVR